MSLDYHKDIRYLCRNCNSIHHPSERNRDALGTSSCPECGRSRRLIIHDRDGYVDYCEVIANWN